MVRRFVHIVIALALVGTGWAIARAQTTAPDFEIIVDSPSGQTTISCVRGCTLSWVERGINPNASATQSFQFACSAARCSSARVGGWISQ
jgi:hypothetical protein